MDGNWRRSPRLFECIYMLSWFIFEADGNLSMCLAALSGLTSGVLHMLVICVWLLVPLYGEVAVLCHRHLRVSVVLSRKVHSIIWFSERVSCGPTGHYFLTRLSLWLDNAWCALKVSLWAWSNCVDMCRSSFCLDSGKLCDCAVRPSELSHRLLDLLWPSGHVAVTVSKGLSPGFLL